MGAASLGAEAWLVYRFDHFRLDSGTRRLLSDEQELHLSPKAFDLLATLIENRSRAMSKAELVQKLWPSTYVLETNLAGLVAEVRHALGDPADRPRYVRTVHRFGYWFVGTLDGGATGEDPVKPPVKYWLIWATGQVALIEGPNVLGRAPDAEVWLDASGVSRHHARIILAGTEATVEDLGSKNGTYVGGQRVTTPCRLADGDQIRLGSVVVTFRLPSPAASTDTTPPH